MRIGILTGGGDCPGLNAVIRAVVRTADSRYGSTVVGFQDGWRGLLEDRKVQMRNEDRIDRILARGGTILGTARVNPQKLHDGLDRIKQTLDDNGIDVLIPIGGEGTLTAGSGSPRAACRRRRPEDDRQRHRLHGRHVRVRHGTDDRDRGDRPLHTTAESHQRVMLVEVMAGTPGGSLCSPAWRPART